MNYKKAIVIGNGESRTSIDLEKISSFVIGCNAIVRDLSVDQVVCVDKKILKEVATAATNTTVIFTSQRLQSYVKRTTRLLPSLPYAGTTRPDDPTHWGSGPYAVLLGALQFFQVELIGFDLYSNNKFINNVYKGSNNYDVDTHRAVDPRYWIHQISRVFECFPQTEFVIYQTPDWPLPEKWNCVNVSVDKISNFTYN